MPKETFFTQTGCDRCNSSLADGYTMSWFNEDTICTVCSGAETKLRQALRENGLDCRAFEGCGYIPTPDGKRPTT